MNGLATPPPNYLLYNSENSKKLAVVVDIPGLDFLTSTTIGRNIEYGDPITYGEAGLLYGGLTPVGSTPGERGQKVLLDLNGGSLTISQRLEPEQGRGSISTLQMTFVDVDQYMTQAISPGIIIPEILGQEVKIWLGYAQTSFPEDYYQVWRGRVAQTVPEIGRVTMQFTDPNIVRRQMVFNFGQTFLNGAIDDVVTTIPVDSNTDFPEKIIGPDGITYDQNIHCYIKVDDEYIEYQQTGHESDGFGVNQFVNVIRGAQPSGITVLANPSVAAAHADGATIDSFVVLNGSAIDIALKVMMSGWGGPYLSAQAIYGLAATGDVVTPIIPNAIVLPVNTDAVRDLGIAVGDYITITGSAIPGNNVTAIVTAFESSLGQSNKIILTNQTFMPDQPTTATIAIRSQFDVWPDLIGSRLPGQEIDVAGFLFYKNTYLLGVANSYSFFISNGNADAAKTFIENQVLLPLGAYSLTRQGKISMGITKPPLADQRTVTLDHTNVIDPQTIKVTRGLNNRKYFNEIDWTYDYDDSGNATSVRNTLDTDSLNSIGVSSVLPIDAQGGRTALDFETILADREKFLFLRYATAAILLDIKTNFGTGNLIEAGDVVLVSDQGQLQIPNLSTGQRNFGQQLMEVINRSLDMKTGQVTLQLEGGVGSLISDRYATVSPSSILGAGTTSTKLIITESYGGVFPGQEYLKWTNYVGLKVHVHDQTYAHSDTTVFTGFDPSNPFAMVLSPALAFTPAVGYIVDIADYPNDTDPTDQALYKLIHAFLDPSVAVTSGVSSTSFNVGVGDEAKFAAGQTILVHNADYSSLSPEVTVLSIVGTLVTTVGTLGFTPDNTMLVELIGFPDGNGPYRMI